MEKILLIEDEKTIRASVAEILSFYNYEVVVAENGKEGFEKCGQENPDLIICDVMMPEMDGYQLLEELKKDESFNTPFIFLTAKVQSDDIRKGMNLGADDYVFKPFKSIDLINTVKVRLEKQKRGVKRLQQRARDLESLVKLMIGHEFNTPMNGIMAMTSFINSNVGKINETEMTNFCEYLNTSTARLQSTFDKVRKLYEVQELEKNILSVKETCDTADLIKSLTESIAAKFKRADDLVLEEIQNTSLTIKSSLLFSAVYEILENAFKFSVKGQPVTVSALSNGSNYQIMISDKGSISSAAELSNYQSFQQFNREKYEQQGLGAGLALSKSILEQNDGSIFFIDNQPNGIIAIINFKM